MKYIQKSINDHMLNLYLEKRFFEMPSFNKTPDWVTYYFFFSLSSNISRSAQWGIKRQITAYDHCAFTCNQLPLGMYQGFQNPRRSRIPWDHGFQDIMDSLSSRISWNKVFHDIKDSMEKGSHDSCDQGFEVMFMQEWKCAQLYKKVKVKVCSAVQDFCETLSFRTITGRDVQAAI